LYVHGIRVSVTAQPLIYFMPKIVTNSHIESGKCRKINKISSWEMANDDAK